MNGKGYDITELFALNKLDFAYSKLNCFPIYQWVWNQMNQTTATTPHCATSNRSPLHFSESGGVGDI